MLEIKDLKKIYKTKKGVPTHALNGVSLKFPERGLVFLLGKSGSGKSTLLNVCGGLDSVTEGEIIIKGRSSKEFTQTDFDSYRNTFVGFIFQEYNILNEFTVEDNIALALELQGKSKDTESINNLLKEVDLEGIGKRKPNTLSGGQKQRIAIARALIKNPEIIMADEPTGALDSNTGKQVFDTLKKLSKDKLIIVVSHDRDFAETYGDRIIELKDGKVISDVSKTEEEQEQLNKNISVIGEDILCINDGEELSEIDFKIVKDFIKHHKNAIICNNQKDVKEFKKAAKINDNGNKETFKDTNNENIELKEYNKKDSQFIKSKLPLRHAFKIGVSSLKVKPFKLLVTVFLCSFAFVLFGLLSTMMLYNEEEVFKETLNNTDISQMRLEKQKKVKEIYYEAGGKKDTYTYYEKTKITEEEYENFKKEYGSKTIAIKDNYYGITNQKQSLPATSFYNTTIIGMAYVEEDNPLRSNITGEYPTKDNEIVISSYLAESLIESGLKNPTNDKIYNLTSTNDLIGKKLELNNIVYTIKGIYQTEELPSELQEVKTITEIDYELIEKLQTALREGLYQIIFISESKMNNKTHTIDDIWLILENGKSLAYKSKDYYPRVEYTSYEKGKNNFSIVYSDTEGLKDNEIIVSTGLVRNFINETYDKFTEQQKYQINDPLGRTCISTYLDKLQEGNLTQAEETKYLTKILNFIKSTHLKTTTLMAYNEYDSKGIDGSSKKFNIVGIYNESMYNSALITTNIKAEMEKTIKDTYIDLGYSYNETTTEYKEPLNAKYDAIYLEYNKSESAINSLYNYVTKSDEVSKFELTNYIIQELMFVNETVEALSKVFLYVGGVTAVFAILLLSNFISTSISNKTREIGILRAVGARSLDVFKIFLSETFVISLICITLSVIGGIVVCGILNKELATFTNINLFVFGVPSIVILIVVAFLTTIIATYLPVYKAAKKKPVDSIRSI